MDPRPGEDAGNGLFVLQVGAVEHLWKTAPVLGNLGMMEQNCENDAEELRMMERMMENNEVLESAWKPGLGGRVSWRSAVRVSWEAFVHLRGAAVNISGPPIDGSFTGESGESDDM